MLLDGIKKRYTLTHTYTHSQHDTHLTVDMHAIHIITAVQNNVTLLQTDGPYADKPHIFQGFEPLPDFEGKYPLIGCWMVASKPVGLCIREDNNLVTGKDAKFIPHVILD